MTDIEKDFFERALSLLIRAWDEGVYEDRDTGELVDDIVQLFVELQQRGITIRYAEPEAGLNLSSPHETR